MNGKTTIALAILALTSVGTMAWLASRDAREPDASPRQSANAEDPTSARPQPRAHASPGYPAARAPAPRWIERPRSEDAPPVDPPEPAIDGVEPPVDPTRSFERAFAGVAAAFESEPVDGGWAARATSNVERVAVGLLPEGSTLEDVTCRGSMCKLTSVQRDEQAYLEFADALVHSEVCLACMYSQAGTAADGRPRLEVYMIREGHEWPIPEA